MNGDISMDMILHFVFYLVLSLSTSFADEVSKACFGVVGLPCAKHNLRCSSGGIVIQEAFYMAGTPCSQVGVSNCVNISSIQLNGTRYNFNDTEMDFLYRNCSTQSKCTFQADRRGEISFSALIYECVNEKTLRSTEANTTRTTATATAAATTTATATYETTAAVSRSSSIVPSDQTTQTENGTGTDTGTVVGIVIPICIIIAGVVTAVIILRRRKLQRKDKNENFTKRKSKPQQIHILEKKSPDYDYATTNECLDLVPKAHNMPAPLKGTSGYNYAGKNANLEVNPHQLSTTSDYDYATCDDQQTNHDNPSFRNTQTRDVDYDHIGRQPARANGHYDTSLSVDDTLKGGKAKDEVYSYNHLNEKVSSNADASTRHIMDASINGMEDDYGYNHLGTEPKKNLPQNEYDTTASAIRDVATMNGDIKDSTYDHAQLITSGCSSSGMTNAGFQESDYDHASPLNTASKDEYKFHASPNGNPQEDGGTDAYTLAREAEANPYLLTK